MRLVDGDELHVEPRQRPHHTLRHQPLGREIKQPHLPRRHAPPDGDVLVPVLRRIDALGRDTGELQRRHLVLHQRHQRRYHDGEPTPRQRRHLVAQRLPRARRHHRQHVPPLEQGGDDPFLAGPEALVTEGFAEDIVRCHPRTSSRSAAIRGPLIDCLPRHGRPAPPALWEPGVRHHLSHLWITRTLTVQPAYHVTRVVHPCGCSLFDLVEDAWPNKRKSCPFRVRVSTT